MAGGTAALIGHLLGLVGQRQLRQNYRLGLRPATIYSSVLQLP